MAAAPPGVVPPVAAPPVPVTGPPTWEELFATPERVFSAPAVPYAVISAALFASADPPDVLLRDAAKVLGDRAFERKPIAFHACAGPSAGLRS